jgi:hypothetical protein
LSGFVGFVTTPSAPDERRSFFSKPLTENEKNALESLGTVPARRAAKAAAKPLAAAAERLEGIST